MRLDGEYQSNISPLDRARVDPTNSREDLRIFREIVEFTRSETVPLSDRAVEQVSAGQDAGGTGFGEQERGGNAGVSEQDRWNREWNNRFA